MSNFTVIHANDKHLLACAIREAIRDEHGWANDELRQLKQMIKELEA